jgi:hypothetical protein
MRRICLAGCFAVLLVAATGCTMCDHPYDYCGPTFTGECGQTCNPLARAGSILSPSIEVTTSGGTAMAKEPQSAPAGKAASEVPAADDSPPATESRATTPQRASRTKPTTTAGRWTSRPTSPPPM